MAEAEISFSETNEGEADVQLVPGGSSVDPLGDVISWLGQVDLARSLSDLGERNSEGNNVRDTIPVQALLHSHRNAAARSGRTQASEYCCSARDMSGALTEEDEWTVRQRRTGASGRLVVYEEGDKPREDILLRGGFSQRIIVTTVTQGGKADQAGVKAGDVLVSMNGRKDFQASSADTIHSSLEAPVILVFMGFVGKLSAEVRLNYKEDVAGFSSNRQIVYPNPDARVHVVDEVFFQPISSGLVLTTAHAPHSRDDLQTVANSGCEKSDSSFPMQGKTDADIHFGGVYELDGSDAQTIVSQAVLGAHPLAAPLSIDNFDECAKIKNARPQDSVGGPEPLTHVFRHTSHDTPVNAQAVKGGAAFRTPESGSMRYRLAGDEDSQDSPVDE